ncbi:hypothetical protein [Flammeovirga sp. SJP92]|uniref:hypothetical protein n=1 Tax=Flammeovirga sp. SJP92 TaxID=1775430 RepID=UPI0007874219|nr:hypothetical protein [Flammeovirga sp. SJP92]KXX71311.1 hypothetical protein AVL50_06805 [Flammeovirga sp. SJP92]
MEKSIESIWKKGFINQEALVAPKINALYEKKSINFVDKFIRDFKINLWAIGVFAFGPLFLGLVGNVLGLGMILSLSLWYLVYYGQKKLKVLKGLEKTNTSYDYIKQFDGWLKNTINGYTKIYRFVYPLVLIISTLCVWETFLKQEIINHYDSASLIWGIPKMGLIMVAIGAVLLSVFARKIYYFDMNLVYGSQFKKLREMIAEMEELRNEE